MNDIFGYDQIKNALNERDREQEQLNMEYYSCPRQKTVKIEKQIEPEKSKFLKTIGKKVLALVVSGAIMVGLGAAFASAIPNEPLPSQDSSTLTQQEMQQLIEEQEEKERAEREDYYVEYSQDGSGDMIVHKVEGTENRQKVVNVEPNGFVFDEEESKGARSNG